MMRHKLASRGLRGALVLGGLCALIPSVYGQAIGVKKLDELLVPTSQKIKRGQVVFDRQCSTCHGVGGKNDSPYAQQKGLAPGGFTTGAWKHGGGTIQIYNLISGTGVAGQVGHPPFSGSLAYQDRWAVAHYVRSLAPADKQPADPADVRKQAEQDAREGVCDPKLRDSVKARTQPKGEAQLQVAAKIFAQQCSSCHGAEGKGDGAAAGGMAIKPRNFHSADQKWTNGTSELAIFNTLTKGITTRGMNSFGHLPEDERWALVHYVRQWVPKSRIESITDVEIDGVCRSLSAPPDPQPIGLKDAMRFMAEDAAEGRERRLATFGVEVYLPAGVDQGKAAKRGEELYQATCASCHGASGVGNARLGPYGAAPPYLYLEVSRMSAVTAAGTTQDFAARAMGGLHTTLPDMTGASLLSTDDWRALQVYVASFGADAKITTTPDGQPPKPVVAPAPVVDGVTPPTDGASKPADGAAKPADATTPAPKADAQPKPAAGEPKPASP